MTRQRMDVLAGDHTRGPDRRQRGMVVSTNAPAAGQPPRPPRRPAAGQQHRPIPDQRQAPGPGRRDHPAGQLVLHRRHRRAQHLHVGGRPLPSAQAHDRELSAGHTGQLGPQVTDLRRGRHHRGRSPPFGHHRWSARPPCPHRAPVSSRTSVRILARGGDTTKRWGASVDSSRHPHGEPGRTRPVHGPARIGHGLRPSPELREGTPPLPRSPRRHSGSPTPPAGSAQAGARHTTGGRPALVIAHTVDQCMGRRSPGSIRQPSRNPSHHAPRASLSRTRAVVITAQVPV